MFGLGGGLFTFAALFYFAAAYEHLSGWKWALASVAVTFTVKGLFPGSFSVRSADAEREPKSDPTLA